MVRCYNLPFVLSSLTTIVFFDVSSSKKKKKHPQLFNLVQLEVTILFFVTASFCVNFCHITRIPFVVRVFVCIFRDIIYLRSFHSKVTVILRVVLPFVQSFLTFLTGWRLSFLYFQGTVSY